MHHLVCPSYLCGFLPFLLCLATLAVLSSWDRRGEILLSHDDDVEVISLDQTNGNPRGERPAIVTKRDNIQRGLEIGDYQSLNNLLEGGIIQLPDVNGSQQLLFITVFASFENIRCSKLRFGDMILASELDAQDTVRVRSSILQLSTDCIMDFSVVSGIANGDGISSATLNIEYVNSTVDYTSPSLDSFPIKEIESCQASAQVTNLNFDGDAGNVLNTAAPALEGVIEAKVRELACDTISPIATTLIDSIVDVGRERVDPYLEPLSSDVTNPLAAENMLNIPADGNLLGWDEAKDELGTWFGDFFRLLESTLWTEIDDPNGPNPNGRDLGINALIRIFLLDGDRAWVLDIDEFPFFETDGVLYEGSDTLTETKVSATQIRVYGLDSFTLVNPMSQIGSYTTRVGPLSLNYIMVEVDTVLEFGISEGEDSLFQGNADGYDTNAKITETVKLTLRANEIGVALTFLLAMNKQILENLNFGFLLISNNIIPCIRSAMENFQVAAIDFNVTSLQVPQFDGFESPGIKHYITESVNAAFAVYQPRLVKAANAFVQTTVRDGLNDSFQNGALFAPPDNINEQCFQQGTEETADDTLDDSGFRLLNFQTLSDEFGDFADSFFETINSYLNATVETDAADNQHGKDSDLQANVLLRSLLEFDSNGAFSFDLDSWNPQGDENNGTSVPNLKIIGLDSIYEIEVLSPIEPQTLLNRIKWKKLSLDMQFSIKGSSSLPKGQARSLQSTEESEDISISIDLAEVSLTLAALLAIDLDSLGDLKLGSVMDTTKILPCLISTTRAARVTQLDLEVGSMRYFNVSGFSSSGISAAISDFVVDLQESSDILVSALEIFVSSTVRGIFNDWLDSYRTGRFETSCPIPSLNESDATSYVDFRQLFLPPSEAAMLGSLGTSPYGDLFQRLYEFVEDVVFGVDPTTGLSGFTNDFLMAPLTKSQSGVSGSLLFESLLDSSFRLAVGGLLADIEIQIRNMQIEGLGTVGRPIAMFNPVSEDPFQLNNTASLGVGQQPLRAYAEIMFSVLIDGQQIHNDFSVRIDVNTVTLILQAIVKVAEARLVRFPFRDMLKFHCWLAAIPAPVLDPRGIRHEGIDVTAAIIGLAASMASLHMNITCISCSGPKMVELAWLTSVPEYGQDLQTTMGRLLNSVAKNLVDGPLLQVQIDRLLNEAGRKCPHSPNYSPGANTSFQAFESSSNEESFTLLIVLGAIVVAIVVSVAVLLLAIHFSVQKRHKTWLDTLSDRQVSEILNEQDIVEELQEQISKNSRSLFCSPEVPTLVRWLMPVLVLGNIGLFLSGHLNLGATVEIEAQIAGETVRVQEFFMFSMAKSTVDIWRAGGKELAILILIFSGIWPYTKQLITLIVWFLPPSTLSIHRRGLIILWLDRLAKWSMVDIFVLVISVAAFRVSAKSPNSKLFPENFYSVDLLVVPLWGLYANMLAQLVSQVSSHFIIHYHRRILHVATAEVHGLDAKYEGNRSSNTGESSQDTESGPPADVGTIVLTSNKALIVDGHTSFKLSEREFLTLSRSEKLVVCPKIHVSVVLAAFATSVFVIVGSTLPSFSLKLRGIIAVAVEFGQNFADATTEYSVFTVMKLLMNQARFLDIGRFFIGLGTLSSLVLLTVFIVPIVQVMALIYQWFSMMTITKAAKLATVNEILQAWQYSEVYLLSIFVASWQLGPISEYMINVYCGGLDRTFAELVHYGLLKEGDDQCFQVISGIKSGFFLLMFGAICLGLLNTYVMGALSQTFRDEEILWRERWHGGDTNGFHELVESNPEEARKKVTFTGASFVEMFSFTLRSDEPVPTQDEHATTENQSIG